MEQFPGNMRFCLYKYKLKPHLDPDYLIISSRGGCLKVSNSHYLHYLIHHGADKNTYLGSRTKFETIESLLNMFIYSKAQKESLGFFRTLTEVSAMINMDKVLLIDF